MKNKILLIFVIIIILGLWEYKLSLDEPRILEVLPAAYSKPAVIDPYYPELVRIVFNKPISVTDLTYTVSPSVSLYPKTRYTNLRSENKISKILYPAWTIQNNKGLALNTLYTLRVQKKKTNIFDYIYPIAFTFRIQTTKTNLNLEKQTIEDLDSKLLNQ